MTRYWRVRVSLEVAEDDFVGSEGRRWREIATSTVIEDGAVMLENQGEPMGQCLNKWVDREFFKLGYEAAFKEKP